MNDVIIWEDNQDIFEKRIAQLREKYPQDMKGVITWEYNQDIFQNRVAELREKYPQLRSPCLLCTCGYYDIVQNSSNESILPRYSWLFFTGSDRKKIDDILEEMSKTSPKEEAFYVLREELRSEFGIKFIIQPKSTYLKFEIAPWVCDKIRIKVHDTLTEVFGKDENKEGRLAILDKDSLWGLEERE